MLQMAGGFEDIRPVRPESKLPKAEEPREQKEAKAA